MPDFRAGERTFQLLTQVAGRAGRGESRRSFRPELHAVSSRDPVCAPPRLAGYYEQEIEFRERCDFPPFQHAVLITVHSAHRDTRKILRRNAATKITGSVAGRIHRGRGRAGAAGKTAGPVSFSHFVAGRRYYAIEPVDS